MRALIYKLLLSTLARLPLRLAHVLGNFAGWLTRKTSPGTLRVIEQNLQIFDASASGESRLQLRDQNLRETGKNFMELGAFWRWPQRRVLELVVSVEGDDIYQQARSEGSGVIVAAPHIGAWELIGLYLTSQHPMHFLYQPNKIPAVDEVIINARERFGGKCYPTSRKGLKQLVEALKRGDAIGILPDQEPGNGQGVFANFFGTPAYTMTFITQLARKVKAPVVFAVMRRLPGGSGFVLHFLKPGEAIYDSDPLVAAGELNRCVEQCVKLAPEQYMWNYKRFRKAPEGAAPRYPRHPETVTE